MSEHPAAIAARTELAQLAATPGRIHNPQKLCDARDFADERLELIVREVFKTLPAVNSRQWEFAQAFSVLAARGLLAPDREGISFGAGRELPLYAISRCVRRLVGTDLYDERTAWETARTADAAAHVLADPPLAIDPGRLGVRTMDMRRLDFSADSFDFAYSICAFEHIGHDPDFLDHLREVRRVLKPGGVYVLTTEVRLGDASYPIEGNYAFAPSHLARLFAESGWDTEPALDLGLARMALNAPREASSFFHHDGFYDDMPIIREYGGIMSGPALFVLTKPAAGDEVAPRGFEVVGLDETRRWLAEQLDARIRLRYRDWVRLNPFGLAADGHAHACSLHEAFYGGAAQGRRPGLVFSTSYIGYGEGEVEAQVVLVPDPAEPALGAEDMELFVHRWPHDDIGRFDKVARHAFSAADLQSGRALLARLRFRVESTAAYAIFAHRQRWGRRFACIDVAVRRSDLKTVTAG